MNPSDLDRFVADLLQSETALVGKEQEVREVVRAFLDARPDTRLNPRFKAALRRRLLGELQPSRSFPSLISLNLPMRRAYYFLGGGLAVVAVTAGLAYYQSNKLLPGGSGNGGVQITRIGEQAFGALSAANITQSGTLSDARQTAGGLVLKQESGGGTAAAPSVTVDQGTASASAPLAPRFNQYVYRGESFTQPDSSVEVLKRRTGERVGGVADLLRSSGLSLLSVSRTNDAAMQSVTYNLEGYRVEVDFSTGRVSMFSQQAVIPMKETRLALPEFTSSAVLPDKEILQIARDFLSRFGINPPATGDPLVERPYVPDGGYQPTEVTVVYPLIINGRSVYDTGGNRVGTRLSVNQQEKKVTGLYGLEAARFESSPYVAETDVSRILSVAKVGGQLMIAAMDYLAPDTPEAEPAISELGTPEPAYVQITQFNFENGTSSDLLVPALAFPLTKKASAYMADRVVVPLAKDLLADPGANSAGGASGSSPGVIEARPLIAQ
jgi:hypothetical protein